MSSSEDLALRLMAIENRLAAIERLLTADMANIQPKTVKPDAPTLSVTEYVLRLKPSSDVERTVVFASFLEEYRHFASFNSDDIASLFMEARIKKPSNIADKIGKNASKGFLMPAGEIDGKKTWKLTMTGQGYIKELENGH
jgi:hypothetical protein